MITYYMCVIYPDRFLRSKLTNECNDRGGHAVRCTPPPESVIDVLTGSQAGSMARSCVRTKKLLVTDTAQLKRTKMETSANGEWSSK